jgi:hypothetical protein
MTGQAGASEGIEKQTRARERVEKIAAARNGFAEATGPVLARAFRIPPPALAHALELVFKVVHPHRPELRTSEIKDFVAGGGAVALK